MISVEGLTVEFGGFTLFDDVSFVVNKKDRIALVGKNGAGKSTMLKIFAGLQSPTSGTVSVPKETTIGYLPQQMKLADTQTVREEAEHAFEHIHEMEKEIERLNQQLAERTDYETESYQNLIDRVTHLTEHFQMMGGNNYHAELERTLIGLGFSREDFDRPTSEFSGGWRMRIELAKLLLRKPDVLLLDEPTNHLDIESIQWLENFIATRANAVILVSHDRAFIDNTTFRTIEIELGKIYDYKVKYSEYVELRKERREQQLRAFENQQKKLADTEAFIERFRYKATKSVQVQSRIKQLEKVERIEVDEVDTAMLSLKFPPAPRSGSYPVIAEDVAKRYGDHLIFEHATFTINRGDKVAFVGGNELAKTVFFKILMGEMEPDEGSFKWGVTTSQAYFPKDSTKEFDNDLTIVDWLTQFSEIKDATYVRGFLGRMLFAGDDGVKQVRVLSGGEKVRCLLSKMMISGANILIFDEPTNHLDMESITALNNGMIKFPGVILFASHDHQIVQTTANRIMEILPNGKLIDKITSYDEYLASDEMAKKRQVYSTEGTLEDN